MKQQSHFYNNLHGSQITGSSDGGGGQVSPGGLNQPKAYEYPK